MATSRFDPFQQKFYSMRKMNETAFFANQTPFADKRV
jgi:hypothetical protein